MDLITMDDLTNDESISLLEDARRLMPVAMGQHIYLSGGKVLGNCFLKIQRELGYLLKPP